MEQFNNSLHFDKRLWSADLEGSKAYSKALAKASIITEAERDEIIKGLDAVKVRHVIMIILAGTLCMWTTAHALITFSCMKAEWAAGTFETKDGDEDIHTANERRLTEIIGGAGGKLHTGKDIQLIGGRLHVGRW